MSWINRLETKFGHWAIPGLLRYVAVLSSLSFVLAKLDPNYLDFLYLDMSRVLQGQVWRLFTYLFIPSIGGLFPDWFSMVFYVIYLFWIGDGLERAWGSFQLNLYYLLGMIGATIAAVISGGNSGGFMLNTTLFLAFARFYPDATILLMFILPVKVKWMAWVTGALIILGLLFGSDAHRLATVAAMINYFLFFGRDLFAEAKMHRQAADRRVRFQQGIQEGNADAMHRCKICGRTEIGAPDVEFRVAADGEEYCVEHLPTR
jgi:hypothetical protein